MIGNKILLLFGGKKKFIWLAGIFLIILTFATKYVSIQHWYEIEWNLESYHPAVPILGLLWTGFYMLILYLRKVWAPSLWFIGAMGLVSSIIMFWAIWLH